MFVETGNHECLSCVCLEMDNHVSLVETDPAGSCLCVVTVYNVARDTVDDFV